MNKEFIINRQGKDMILYGGLLDLAHQSGLVGISTEIIQLPTQQNHFEAICKATVIMEQDGVTKSFSGIGDSTPDNTNKMLHTCLLRMSETRAKARALRDAVNIGMVCADEVHEERPRQAAQPKADPPRAKYEPKQAAQQEHKPNLGTGGGKITPAQYSAIEKLAQDDDVYDYVNGELAKLNCKLGDLTLAQAAQLITEINKGNK